jgi:hypothetical protein
MTLVEVMGATLILAVAVIGASAYRYHSALDARKADERATATRIAMLLCENWRGVSGAVSGDEAYNPEDYWGHGLEFNSCGHGPEVPMDFTSLATCSIELNGITYYATLSWKDVATGLRALNVVVAWDQRGAGSGEPAYAHANKSFKLTTYATY